MPGVGQFRVDFVRNLFFNDDDQILEVKRRIVGPNPKYLALNSKSQLIDLKIFTRGVFDVADYESVIRNMEF